MTRRTRGRRAISGGHGEHDEPDERWAVSYADMVTVLMCLFIVLFAMSEIDSAKYETLANSLSEGFGQEVVEGGADTSEGVVVPEELLDEDGAGFTASAVTEYQSLEELKKKLERALRAAGLAGTATFTIDDRGLTIGLVGAETFFATNSTDLAPKAIDVLRAIAGPLSQIDNQLHIEGHADHRAPAAPFPTNWELSSGRATQVTRYLVEHGRIAGTRVEASGFSDTRPLAKGTTPSDLAKNRRVDIVVVSKASEQVREALPGIAAANGKPTTKTGASGTAGATGTTGH